MVKQRIVGDLENFILQRFQVDGTGNLPAVSRIDEDEIAERKILRDIISEFDRKGFRIFIKASFNERSC